MDPRRSTLHVPSELRSVSNWGRWGDDDEAGTLNLIPSASQLAALGLARQGVSVSLSREVTPHSRPDTPQPVHRFMRRNGVEAPERGMGTASEWLGFIFHGFSMTHLDAPSHVFWDGKMYNGRDAAAVSGHSGARWNAVTGAGSGIIGRGVLLDVARHREADWLEPGDGIAVDELLSCARSQNVEIEEGDILLFRTGRPARERVVGNHNPIVDGNPGLEESCAEWLHRQDVAVLGSDVVQDVMHPGNAPHPMPIHVLGLVGMGLWLIDNMDLEELSRRCAALNRWEFTLILAPLRIWRGTGSPVNPIAVL